MKKILFLLAFITFLSSCSKKDEGRVLLIGASPEAGFYYPYYLFIPEDISAENKSFIIIEPNNSGFVDDDFSKHLEKAERTATRDFYMGNFLSRTLKSPLLVPVFPRSKTQWEIYTHALDRDVVIQQSDTLKRIDLQVLAMFDDARKKLDDEHYKTEDQFLMTGFSASGTFVNRFCLIHPDKVKAVAAGGLNGLLMLPLDSLNSHPLKYPLGTQDFETLFDQSFDLNSFAKTPQFYFMGQNDDNDAIGYDDAFDADERTLIYQLMGEEMQPKRWEACIGLYEENQINAIIKTYADVGHEVPDHIKQDMLGFFKNILAGKSNPKK